MAEVIPANNEILAILHRNFESKDLDYKGPIGWDSKAKKACCELVKDIMAMANTQGGYIVIGIAELDHGFRLDGVSIEQAGTFESSEICRFVQKYADPPINVRVQKVTSAGLRFVILEVPRFTDTPHICQKDFPEVLRERELYIRTDNNESAAMKSSADFRALIEAAVRNRTDSLLTSFRSILTGQNVEATASASAALQFQKQVERARTQFELLNPLKEKNFTFFIETVFEPIEFDQYRFTPNRLESAAQRAHVDFVGWPFLFFHYNRRDVLSQTDDGIETLINTTDFAGLDILDFWRFNESGLFYKRELTPTSHTKPPDAAAPRIVWQFAESIFCLTRLYEGLFDDTDPIKLTVTLFGTRGRSLVWNEIGFVYRNVYQANRPEIKVTATHTLAEWRAGLEDYAVELSREVFRSFQLDNPDESRVRTQIKNIFARRL
jgi:Putative DNA-binding domain